ncbi:MAG TPA: hypothetical protein VFP93_01610 [Gammaproteobacteria bacterium]|nr:hypothetical protein [Gammaproteobacteria bacterium]
MLTNAPLPTSHPSVDYSSTVLLFQFHISHPDFFHKTTIELDQNVLEAKQFESQFGYVLGKVLRASVEKMQSIMHALKETAMNHLVYPLGRFFYLIDKDQLEQKLDNDMVDLYKFLERKIEAAKRKADKNRKPLMILIGENHYSPHSALVQSMILTIAKEKLCMHSILTESFFESAYTTLHAKSILTPSLLIEEQAKKMNLTKIPLDYALCRFLEERKPECPMNTPNECKTNVLYDQVSSPMTNEALFVRNKVMANVALHAKVNETVTIVGGGHLKGLIEDTALKENYELLPINSFFHDNVFLNVMRLILEHEVPELNYLENSDKVLQTQIPSLTLALSDFPPEKLVEKAQSIKPKKIFEIAKLKA